MKKLLFAVLLAFLASTAEAQTYTANFSWTNTDSSYGPGCPATAPKMCLGNLTIQDITSLTPVILSAAIAYNATSYSYSFPTTPSFGNHTYAIFATGFNATGAPVQSTSTTATVDIEPPSPSAITGFTVTYKVQ